MINERLQVDEQFDSMYYLLEMPCSEMCLKSPSQKLNFVMTKAVSRGYTLGCVCKHLWTFHHSHT